jgi:hypothetical protein
MFREWFYRNRETGVRRHKTSEDSSEEIWMFQTLNEWDEISKEEYHRLGKDKNHGKIN